MTPAPQLGDVVALVAVLVTLVAGAAAVVRRPDTPAGPELEQAHACMRHLELGCPVAGQ